MEHFFMDDFENNDEYEYDEQEYSDQEHSDQGYDPDEYENEESQDIGFVNDIDSKLDDYFAYKTVEMEDGDYTIMIDPQPDFERADLRGEFDLETSVPIRAEFIAINEDNEIVMSGNIDLNGERDHEFYEDALLDHDQMEAILDESGLKEVELDEMEELELVDPEAVSDRFNEIQRLAMIEHNQSQDLGQPSNQLYGYEDGKPVSIRMDSREGGIDLQVENEHRMTVRKGDVIDRLELAGMDINQTSHAKIELQGMERGRREDVAPTVEKTRDFGSGM
jgi:hypothetical protein